MSGIIERTVIFEQGLTAKGVKKAQIFVILLSLLLIALSNTIGFAQPAPGSKQTYSILLWGGTAHLGDGTKIEDAAIGFKDGKITYVGSMQNAKKENWNKVIDTQGNHIYPAFIAPNSTLGLQEIGAVRATRDQREVGLFKPNVRSLIAYNTESDITTTVKSNGVLLGQITPRGGVISGTSSVVQFDAWNWEDAVIREDDGIHLNWPRVFARKTEKGKTTINQEKRYEERKQAITTFFEEAEAYSKTNASIKNLKFESLLGIWNGSKTLYVHASSVKQITAAVNFKKEFGIVKMTIVGGYDSWMVTDLLRDNNVSVMLQRAASLPRYQDDDYDLPFRLPKLLADARILFCLENAGDMERMQTRNLPFYGGIAVAYGLTYEQAVQAMTGSTAKILGIDDVYGTLSLGKSASLFVSSGDALDMRTNNVTFAYIDGRTVVLDNRQKELYLKFRGK